MTSYQRLRLLLTSALDPNQKLVGIALSDHMSDTRGYALCGVARLARLTSLSERTVQRVLNQGDGVWLKRDIKPGAKQYPTYILWSKLPKQEETGDSGSPVQDSHPCQAGTGDEEAQVTGGPATGDSLSEEGCQPVRLGVTGCHPKPTIKPTSEANERSQPAPPPPQEEPEPDWEAIQAKILGSLDEARDAEIDGYFTSPIEPPPAPIPTRIMPRALPPASPSLAESLARIKQAVEANPAPRQEPTPQRQAPVVEEDLGPSPVAGMDLPTLLGSGAASQRLLRALVAGGISTAEALERVTFDDLKFMPGVSTTGANAIREALGKHGAGLAMDKGRLLLLSRLAVDHPKPWPPEVTRADKVALKAARVRWRTLAEADDFKITDIYRAIEAGRRV